MAILRPLSPDALRNSRWGSRFALVWVGLLACLLAVPGTATARGWLGVSVQDVDPSLREAMNLPTAAGALVSDVSPGSPADQAGIRARDVIVRVDESPVEDSSDLIGALREKQPGDEVTLSILRDDKQLALRLILTDQPDRDRSAALPTLPRAGTRPQSPLLRPMDEGGRLGVQVHTLDLYLAPYFEVEPGKGLLILQVESGSPAEEAGLLPGDVLMSFNGEPLAETSDLRREVLRLDPGADWKASGVRKGRPCEFHGRMLRDWKAPMQPDIIRKIIPFHENRDGDSIFGRREARRLEREMEKLRERIRRLERRIAEMRGR